MHPSWFSTFNDVYHTNFQVQFVKAMHAQVQCQEHGCFSPWIRNIWPLGQIRPEAQTIFGCLFFIFEIRKHIE